MRVCSLTVHPSSQGLLVRRFSDNDLNTGARSSELDDVAADPLSHALARRRERAVGEDELAERQNEGAYGACWAWVGLECG